MNQPRKSIAMLLPTGRRTLVFCAMTFAAFLQPIAALYASPQDSLSTPQQRQQQPQRQQGDQRQQGRQEGGRVGGQRRPNQQGGQQGGQRKGGGGGSGLGGYEKPPSPANDVPNRPFDILLGRPTDSAITIRILPFEQGQGTIRYAPSNTPQFAQQTKPIEFQPQTPLNIELTGLQANTRYNYVWEYQTATDSPIQRSAEFSFHTQRTVGESFTFTVTSDSHLDENSSGEVYLRTLANAAADQPDFHLELGDTFMTGKYKKPEFSYGHYLSQRYYLGSICHSVTLYFVLGNHDGESVARGDTLWATRTRKALFPNPTPNTFYSGNQEPWNEVGALDNYYAWQWGDALFIALDPYRYTTERPRRGENNPQGNWFWTLGENQYKWLEKVLETSDAKYKFVFIHHLVGGADQNNRGGIEAAPFWEWGGKNTNGIDEFHKYRPNWKQPIHRLLVENGVQVVFHGHDHFFAKQDLDGIVYQEVPQPSHARVGNTRTAAEYGYLSGEIQPSSGHIRIRISPDASRIDYIRSYLPKDENNNRQNAEISYSYQVTPISK